MYQIKNSNLNYLYWLLLWAWKKINLKDIKITCCPRISMKEVLVVWGSLFMNTKGFNGLKRLIKLSKYCLPRKPVDAITSWWSVAGGGLSTRGNYMRRHRKPKGNIPAEIFVKWKKPWIILKKWKMNNIWLSKERIFYAVYVS